MLRLRCAHHVENLVGGERVDAVANRGEIGRGVPEAFVSLLHDHGQRFAVSIGEAGGKDALGAVGVFN